MKQYGGRNPLSYQTEALTLRLPKPLLDDIEALARDRAKTRSQLIRELLAREVDRAAKSRTR